MDDTQLISIEVKDNTEKDYSKIRIGLANLNVDEKTLEKTYEPLEIPDISLERWLKISNLLNIGLKEKCNLLIFPECSIPYKWLTELTRWVREHQIGLVFGMEYLYQKNTKLKDSSDEAYNFVVTILPLQTNDYKSCCISLRLKNHYAPNEIKNLEKMGY